MPTSDPGVWTDTGSLTPDRYFVGWDGTRWDLVDTIDHLHDSTDINSTVDAMELTFVSNGDFSTVVATATANSVADSLALGSAVAAKQDRLTGAQLAAANSGATATKVTTWDNYASQISGKADTADLRNALSGVTKMPLNTLTNADALSAVVNAVV